jgi:class 3 adenylate cyclase
MVRQARLSPDSIAQYTGDVLCGAIEAIESQGGEVVAFMGDAILGIVKEGEAAVRACFLIAKQVNRQC